MSNPFAEIHLKGLPISAGMALAPACLLNDHRHVAAPQATITDSEVTREQESLHAALRTVHTSLENLVNRVAARVGKSEANIFEALKSVLDDPVLQKQMLAAIEKTKCTAEIAVATTFDSYIKRLHSSDNVYMKERATDMRDLKAHLLDALRKAQRVSTCDGLHHCARGKDRIVVTSELMPSLVVKFDVHKTEGFLTEHGGETSHAAILARSLGVPAVSGLLGVATVIECGTELLINGSTGDVYVWPSAETKARCMAATTTAPHVETETPVPGFAVLANISGAADMDDVHKAQAEGIGLYRTEFEFIGAGRVLDEDAQYERYAAVLKRTHGTPAYLRMLDIGGDKPFHFMQVPKEANPHLGCRGARFLLAHPDLLVAQARAIVRAAQHCSMVGVMYPMITGAAQFVRIKKLFEEAVHDLPHGSIQHGVLFEVPSACLDAEAIFAIADFGSVGTNDLTQYLFAVDRGNDLVAADYMPDQPVMWALLSSMARAANAAGKPLSVCGELAGNPKYTRQLIATGIRMVSTNARSIAAVRSAARQAMK